MRRWFRVLVVLGLIVMVACSSDDDERSASTKGGSTTTGATRSQSTSTSASTSSTDADADWVTWGHDNLRTGVTADGPGAKGLHEAWRSDELDGDAYAQPLIVGDQVIVATQQNVVAALDLATGDVKWKVTLGDPVPGSDLPCGNVDPVGVTSTPVADPDKGVVYVVAMLASGSPHHELFALDLDDGKTVFHHGADAPGADPDVHNQRGALALTGGDVYVPYGGRFGDCGDYHGRLVRLAADGSGDAGDFELPTQREGGFWAPAGPVVAPDGSFYLSSGNSGSDGPYDYGNSVVRLSHDLKLADSFAPEDWVELNRGDVDLGSVSPALLGDRVFTSGKAGIGYLLDAAHLGGIGGALHQEKICDGGVYGGLAHDDTTVLVPCTAGELEAFTTSDTSFATGWTAAIDEPGPPIVAGQLVWVLEVGDGVLHAFDRATGKPKFDADVGSVTHFSAPAAGHGRVVVAAGGRVHAFSD
jgi:outer membrane protein assembly factor BamB